jgi:LL-diaminopimelate aminotransferase
MPITPADRLTALPPYLFAEIDRRKNEALRAGRDVIDFGVGDPDEPTHGFIIEAMQQAIRRPELHRYPFGGGLPRFRATVAAFMQRRYGVEVHAQHELVALIGSKEGLGHLPLAVVNPGQTVLVPSPGYPAYHAGTIFAGGEPYVVELSDRNGWLMDFAGIPADVAKRAVLMFINYPNNPTGAVAPREFYRDAVAFAREHDILLASDAAYNDMYFSDVRPPSVLEIPGAKDVAIEFHSASKTFNMTGWRIGFAVGNAAAIAALTRIKSNLDTGVFGAIQEAAVTAYESIERPEIAASRATYRKRGRMMCEALRPLGFVAEPPLATFYLWARTPGGALSMTVAERLLEEANIVCVPGLGFGKSAEGYVRFSLSVPTSRMEAAIERLRRLRW